MCYSETFQTIQLIFTYICILHVYIYYTFIFTTRSGVGVRIYTVEISVDRFWVNS